LKRELHSYASGRKIVVGLVNTAQEFQGYVKGTGFIGVYAAKSFSRWTSLHGVSYWLVFTATRQRRKSIIIIIIIIIKRSRSSYLVSVFLTHLCNYSLFFIVYSRVRVLV